MKHISKILLTIISVGLMTTACNNSSKNIEKVNTSTFDHNAVKKIIQDNNDAFMKAHVMKDTATLNHMFAMDAKASLPNSEVITGRTNIAAVNLEWVNYDIKEAREKTTALYGNEDYIIGEGTYYMSFGTASIVDKGKYINIWKQEDGKWKLYRNRWNSSLPSTTE